MSETITILGAGMVGISCARELQQRGFDVTLIDRRGPGEETSSGNAGLLSYSNITPIASPALLPRLHRLILNRELDFRLHYPHLPRLLPWLVRFLARCNRQTYLRDGEAMAAITFASIELHLRWIEECNAQSLLLRNGGLKLYREQRSFDEDSLERELFDLCGVKYTLLERAQISDYEPDLNDIFAKAVFIDETPSVKNPQKLCKAYAENFLQHGGRFVQKEVKHLDYREGSWQLHSDQGSESLNKVVLCMGAWTGPMLKQLSYANPMAIERGYHSIFAAAEGRVLNRPIFDVDASHVIAPMDMGLRVSSGSNLVHGETDPDYRQINQVRSRLGEAFPMGAELSAQPWMGRRPTLPDTLPMIGAAPRHKDLWLAFGHSHMGFTMGPISGHLIANDITGAAQPFSIDPYRPQRYI
ncbi:MAG: D-amino-acid dehydrogenase [Planctomycetota bacterium]|jgi:D-amino-acid dehydrogenase